MALRHYLFYHFYFSYFFQSMCAAYVWNKSIEGNHLPPVPIIFGLLVYISTLY